MPTVATPAQHVGRPSGINQVGTVVSVSGLSVLEAGGPNFERTTVFTFSAMSISITDASAYASQQIYDFPRGKIQILGGSSYLAFTTTSTIASTLNSGVTVQYGFGSAAASATTLASTMIDVLPGIGHTVPTFTSSTTINVASTAVTSHVGAFTSITALTAGIGTANNSLQDCTSSYSEAAVENNFEDVAQKINEIIARLNGMGNALQILDGSITAKDLYLNLAVGTGGDIDADATVTVSGTLVLRWTNLGVWDFPYA